MILPREKSFHLFRLANSLPKTFRFYNTAAVKSKSLNDFMALGALNGSLEIPSPAEFPPYLKNSLQDENLLSGDLKRKIYIETYGCQMNFNDTEIVLGVLEKTGRYERVSVAENANVVLLMTCAIRENAESKIWSRLDYLNSVKRSRKGEMTVGVLGCMAERLKTDLMEKKRVVDIVCGPDAYRDLPRLLEDALGGINGINVILSADETYADIAPIRLDPSKKSAFVSIMRGCNNMCAFCIVPFTRGRERSRPIESIVEEVEKLYEEGVREVILLGQNVNSYCDDSVPDVNGKTTSNSRGFSTIYKPKVGGRRFVELLDQVSMVNPNMRIRFTSPHPKDFPDPLLKLMRDRPNICKQIHLPAQSGSNSVLERMRRGYTKEAYLDLVCHIRRVIPNVSFSSDFISGFCGETEEDHEQTLSLIDKVDYDMAYMFAYSMREKTMAHRRYADDVPEEVKQRRLSEIIDKFYSMLTEKVKKTIGQKELVLVEGTSKKSDEDLCGRGDSGRTIVFPNILIMDHNVKRERVPQPGDYVEVEVVGSKGITLRGKPIKFTSIVEFNNC